MKMRFSTRFLIIAFASLLPSILLFGQSRPSPTLNTPDGTVILPMQTGILGQSDSGATTELANHRAAVGSVMWQGMQGTGTVTYGSQDPTSYEATLSNLGGTQYRLDSKTKNGQMSTRINGELGKLQRPDGTVIPLPIDASSSGIFPFELLRTISLIDQSLTLKDQGLTTLNGRSLHRLTLERRAVGVDPTSHKPRTNVIDYYFDTATHLLSKSTQLVPSIGHRVLLLSIVTYNDYRVVGGELIPFKFVETMQGIPYRSLQLSEVHVNPLPPSTSFTF